MQNFIKFSVLIIFISGLSNLGGSLIISYIKLKLHYIKLNIISYIKLNLVRILNLSILFQCYTVYHVLNLVNSERPFT